MEQAPFVMWTKRNQALNRNPSYDDSSWEEQAFAEDALGPLGGCVWPPRSYSCSFCRREFRSAQALGGHMNVHRRDRARLKQSPVDPPEHRQQDHQANQFQNSNHQVSMDLPYLPRQDCGYNPNPNPNCDLLHPFVSPTSPNSRVSASSPSDDHGNNLKLNPFYFSSGVKETNTKPTVPSPQSWPNSAANRYYNVMMSRPEKQNLEIGHEEDDSIKDKIPVSLNLVIRARLDAVSIEKEEERSCKRRRLDDSSLLPLFFDEIDQPEKMMHEFSSIREDDLDLELRLGGRPKKVKLQS